MTGDLIRSLRPALAALLERLRHCFKRIDNCPRAARCRQATIARPLLAGATATRAAIPRNRGRDASASSGAPSGPEPWVEKSADSPGFDREYSACFSILNSVIDRKASGWT